MMHSYHWNFEITSKQSALYFTLLYRTFRRFKNVLLWDDLWILDLLKGSKSNWNRILKSARYFTTMKSSEFWRKHFCQTSMSKTGPINPFEDNDPFFSVKSVQIRSFFRSIFSLIWTKYGDLRTKFIQSE